SEPFKSVRTSIGRDKACLDIRGESGAFLFSGPVPIWRVFDRLFWDCVLLAFNQRGAACPSCLFFIHGFGRLSEDANHERAGSPCVDRERPKRERRECTVVCRVLRVSWSWRTLAPGGLP